MQCLFFCALFLRRFTRHTIGRRKWSEGIRVFFNKLDQMVDKRAQLVATILNFILNSAVGSLAQRKVAHHRRECCCKRAAIGARSPTTWCGSFARQFVDKSTVDHRSRLRTGR